MDLSESLANTIDEVNIRVAEAERRHGTLSSRTKFTEGVDEIRNDNTA